MGAASSRQEPRRAAATCRAPARPVPRRRARAGRRRRPRGGARGPRGRAARRAAGRVREALLAAGIARSTATSAPPSTCCAPARTWSSPPARRAASRLCFQLPRSTRSPRDAQAPRPVPLPHQGARPGPGAQAARAAPPRRRAGDLRRRHAAGAARAHARRTAHHRAQQPRHAARRHPARPRTLGRVPAPPALRRARRGARLPRRLRLARGPGRAPPAAPLRRLRLGRRSSCSPRRRSPTRRASPRRLVGLPFAAVDEDGAPHPERTDRALEPAAGRPRPRHATQRPGRGQLRHRRGVLAGARVIGFAPTRKAAELVYEPRAPPLETSATPARGRRACSRTAPATRRSSAARSSAACSTHELDAVVATRRSSWASTSAASTCRSSPASPARSRACGSAGAGPAAPGTAGPCWSPARTRSTSTSCASPSACSRAARRGGDHRPAQPAHPRRAPARRPPTSARSRRPTSAYFGEQGMLRAERARRRPAALRRQGDGLVVDQAALARRRRQPAHRLARPVRDRRDDAPATSSARSSRSASSASPTPARSTCTSARATSCSASTSTSRIVLVDDFDGDLLHAGQDRQERAHRRPGRHAAAARARRSSSARSR